MRRITFLLSIFRTEQLLLSLFCARSAIATFDFENGVETWLRECYLGIEKRSLIPVVCIQCIYEYVPCYKGRGEGVEKIIFRINLSRFAPFVPSTPRKLERIISAVAGACLRNDIHFRQFCSNVLLRHSFIAVTLFMIWLANQIL